MAYALSYHPRVADTDLPKIPAEARDRIARAIEAKLAEAPERFGVPLKGTLRGYRKLRVGDHRVVFKLEADTVWILAIIHRKDVYERVARRSAATNGSRQGRT